jgi:hypothetical protein
VSGSAFFIPAMRTTTFILIILAALACKPEPERNDDVAAPDHDDHPVSLHHFAEQQKVEVFIDGALFTEYRYALEIKKPVLFPLIAADGTILSRGYPLEPRPGEQTDHLHHVGQWLDHGVVNEVDFWAATPEKQSTDDKTYGSVIHRKITEMSEGETGALAYTADWISDRGEKLLVEQTRFVFSGEDDDRIIDRITTLEAQDEAVVFEDSKEGMMAVRVARFMEQPYDEPQELIGTDGKPMAQKVVDNAQVKGEYLNSDGLRGDAVWGQRANWVSLAAPKEGKTYAITIMDHPSNVNYPTHWMARGYGLFAANPLGSKVYSEGKEELNLTLAPGESTKLTYRILLHSGEALSQEKLDSLYQEFTQSY